MFKKRNLYKELKVKSNNKSTPFDIDINKIKKIVNNNIDSAYSERTNEDMKLKIRHMLGPVLATVAISTTVFAAGGIIKHWSGHSYKIDYETLPSASQCTKDVGYSPVLIDSFKNGYEFNVGRITDERTLDEDGNEHKFKALHFDYKNSDNNVYLYTFKCDSGAKLGINATKNIDGTYVYFSSNKIKFVPEGYTKTEEDKKAEGTGEYSVSFGGKDTKTELKEFKNITWVKDGINYLLQTDNESLSEDELIDMAQEIIQTK